MKTTVERATNGPDKPERRRWDRADLLVRVDYKTVDELFSEFARNINEGGLFVETDAPPALGTSVALEFQIPGSDEPIQVMGRVVRVSDGSGKDGPGMGIEFENLDSQSRDLINDLVRQLRVGSRDE
jgi:type IV pilus assembly protein PilZ